MIQENPAIVWLRQDLRLADNPALQAVSNHPFFALYIWDENDPCCPGGLHGGGFIKA
jgi:deoxyribodipyrimidine photo-lyase